MELLFKLKEAETAMSTIGDSNFKEHYPSINKSMQWSQLKPYIRQATLSHVIPYLGTKFYQDLITHFKGTAEDAILDSITTHLQDAIAYFTISRALPFINLVISDMGAQQNASDNGTSQPSAQWRFKQTFWSALMQAYTHLDIALKTMEDNLDSNKLSEWKDSEEYKTAGTTFFRYTGLLNNYLNIQNSRRAFISLTPYLKNAETDFSKIICREAYAALVSKMANPDEDLSSAEIELLDKARYFMSCTAMLSAIPHLRVVLDGDGIRVLTQTDGMDIKSPASDKSIEDLKNDLRTKVEIGRADIFNLLHSQLDAFPEYKEHGYLHRTSKKVIGSSSRKGGIFVN